MRIKSSNDGSWCCTASLVDGGPSNKSNTRDIDIQRIAGYQDSKKNNSTANEEVNEDGKQEEAKSKKDRNFSQQQQQSAAAEATLLDLTKAADWMEYIEVTEGRVHDEGGAGAYDTLRCDLPLQRRRRRSGSSNNSSNHQSSWNVWGLDFHLDRLEQSYQSLLLHQVTTTRETTATTAAPRGGLASLHKPEKLATLESSKRMMHQARQDSVRMLEALLAEAGRAQEAILQKSATTTPDDNDDDDVVIQMVRLTWLWSPPPAAAAAAAVAINEEQDEDNDGNSSTNDDDDVQTSIVVRGHAVCSTRPVRVHQAVQPITCTIAADAHHHHHNTSHNNNNIDNYNSSSEHSSVITVDESLPSRVDHPQSKVASWTRLRKKLEKPDSFKPPGVSEVLLVRPKSDDDNSGAVEILEGLSSNLFVLYRDGTLRTPTDGVLHGYVRHLVLECAASCGKGLEVDSSRPILLQDVHEWKEAFITSSSRLIFPIAKMLLHDGEDEHGAPVFREFWQDPKLLSSSSDAGNGNQRGGGGGDDDKVKPKWQQLLDEILRRGGYPTDDEKNGQ